MAQNFTFSGQAMTLLQCGSCGVFHAIPQERWDNCKEEGGFWYCSNGHQRGFREGAHEREAVRRERDRLKQENARLAGQAAESDHKRILAERRLTSHKRRAAAGVCPCCKRTFGNMARHMAKQHPEFVVANVVSLADRA